MFEKIQNNLLLRQPLLWNLRIVPVVAVTLIIHLLYFMMGYGSGTINFAETNDYYNFRDTSNVILVFGILVSIFIFIIWMVFYFRNNAYKSFYPKSAVSLYKEWLLILLACVLNCTYTCTFLYAKGLHKRNYFSEKEFSRRIDILSMASLFTYGSYKQNPDEVVFEGEKRIEIHHDSLLYKGKNYTFNSLINKNITSYSYQSGLRDSLNEMRVKGWLVHNQKDSVIWLMREFDKIAKNHNLKASVTPQQWAALTFNYPAFTKYKDIRDEDKMPASEYKNLNGVDIEDVNAVSMDHEIDTTDYTFREIEGYQYAFPKYYVPENTLHRAYDEISGAWAHPEPDSETIVFQLYFALVLAMAMFSFRVTSGRDWLIALVATGVTGMVTGIFSLIGAGQNFFQLIWVIIPLALLAGFFIISTSKNAKGKSGIVLNALLWLVVWILPLLQFVIVDILRPDYDSRNDYADYNEAIEKDYPVYYWLNHNTGLIMFLNILFIIAIMCGLSISIKRWKGLPEA